MKSITALLFVGALTLSGCATSPGNMRNDPEAKRVATIDLGYQLALKRIVDWWAECSMSPLLPLGTVINDVQHYPDLRQASIVRGASGVGTQIHAVIDMRELGPTKTELVIFTKIRPDAFLERHRLVALGSTDCGDRSGR